MGEGSGKGGIIAFTFFVGLLAIGAIAVAVVAFIRIDDLKNDDDNNGGSDNGNGGSGSAQGKDSKDVWYIAMGSDYGAFEYIDDDGYLVGFSKDLSLKVCEKAGIECVIIEDKYSNCWSDGFGGTALMSGWYDACASWFNTVGRSQVFDFTQAYAKGSTAHFYVRSGVTNFDPKDITGKKIGLKTSWASDAQCISRQKDITGTPVPEADITYFDSDTQGLNLLQTNQVDAVFILDADFEVFLGNGQVDMVANSEADCFNAGPSLMVRKRSPLIDYFNDGLQQLISSGEYREMCNKANNDYAAHGTVECN